MAYIKFKKDCYFGYAGETIMVQENHAADMIRRGFAHDPAEKAAEPALVTPQERPEEAKPEAGKHDRQRKNEEMAARSKR
jgi:hypothetical protein